MKNKPTVDNISKEQMIVVFEHIFYSTLPYQQEQYRPMIKDFLTEENISLQEILDEIDEY